MKNKEKLFAEGAISRDEIDELKKLVVEKRKDVSNLALSLDTGTEGVSSLEVLKRKIGNLNSDLKALQGKITFNHIQQSNIVSAVSNGVVSEIGYQSGDPLTPMKKVFSILNLDTTYIEAKVSEKVIHDVKIGASAEITPIADLFKKYHGKVSSISAIAMTTNDETVFLVNLSLTDRHEGLYPNQNVEVKISKF